jgi:hypothetical protein
MDRILDIQLKKLKTDHIDYYLLHSLEAHQWKRLFELGVLEFLDSAKASGKIVNAGFSFHGDRKTFKEIIDAYDWTFCQIQYNFLDETNQAGTDGLRYAAARISPSWSWNRSGAGCWPENSRPMLNWYTARQGKNGPQPNGHSAGSGTTRRLPLSSPG